MRHALWLLPALLLPPGARAADRPQVVAAESAYADIAAQIAGQDAAVVAILADPAADPHLFSPTSATAATLSTASIVIYNGGGYDPWMRAAVTATGSAGPRRVIDVADLMRAGEGTDGALWYDPRTMPVVATALARALEQADPAHAAAYDSRLTPVLAALAALTARVAALRAAHAGQSIAMTATAFAPMAAALDLHPVDPAAVADDLRHHRIRALLHDHAADTDDTRQLVRLAAQSGVAVVPIDEGPTPGAHYQAWLTGELGVLDTALGPSRRQP